MAIMADSDTGQNTSEQYFADGIPRRMRLLREISALLQPVTLALQAVGTDLMAALNSIDSTVKVLRQWRSQSETTFQAMFTELATIIASDVDLQISKPRTAKRCVYRSTASVNANHDDNDIEDYYGINVFNQMLDEVTNDIEQRFSPHQRQSLLLSHFLLHNAPHASWDDIKPAVDKFRMFLDPCDYVLKSEFTIWQQYCSSKKDIPVTLSAVGALKFSTCVHVLSTLTCTLYCTSSRHCQYRQQSQSECSLRST